MTPPRPPNQLIVPEEHIEASSYDAACGMCVYRVRFQGELYTVEIPLHELERHGTAPGHQGARRQHLLRMIAERLKGEPDAP